jgi:hypothetical protein
MARCRRVSLFRREIKERVSPAGFDLLLDRASKISEGQISGQRYYGSTMLTLDLRAVEAGVSEPCDVATAQRLARLLAGEPEILDRLRGLALADARRIARRKMGRLETDLRVRTESSRVLIDIDVEGETVPISARSSR